LNNASKTLLGIGIVLRFAGKVLWVAEKILNEVI